jgi:hypothetical protein
MPSPLPVDLSALAGLPGVKGYIVVDGGGRLIVLRSEPPGSGFAQALAQWGKRCAKVGKGFRYLAFTRKSGEQLAMFRVGPNFLGVTLKNQAAAKDTLEEIVTIINSLTPGERGQSDQNGQTETEVSP